MMTKKDIIFKEIMESENPNEKIKKVISDKKERFEVISEEISKLNEEKGLLDEELECLDQIKRELKLILDITKDLKQYEEKIKSEDNYNKWNDTFDENNTELSTSILNITNKLYYGSIVRIYNYKKDIYRVDYKLCLNDILIRYAKANNGLNNHVSEVKVISGGKIFFNREDADKYVLESKEQLEPFFDVDVPFIYRRFTDEDVKYSADTFLKFGGIYLNGITIYDGELINPEKSDEIPF